MKILIFSDSHGKTGTMTRVTERLHTQITAVIHLGDCYRDLRAVKALYPQLQYYAVPGNCDHYTADPNQLVEIGGKRIFITHGHEYGVKRGLDKLKQAAADVNADACLFGHSHDAEKQLHDGILFLNPGSTDYPRGRFGASYGVITVSDGQIDGNAVEITKHGGIPLF
jgi:hypothetical protein